MVRRSTASRSPLETSRSNSVRLVSLGSRSIVRASSTSETSLMTKWRQFAVDCFRTAPIR